ncbi:hypothetical protein C8Q75DRAFT_172866 [Abortiporus biennis]|nr:hypothetical protein C8Q75DRAFT_172866 [Abortiporus biennis]
MSDKRRDHYHDIVSNVPEQMRTPGRPLEELLKTDDKITPVEALTMMEHYTKGAIEPDNCKHVLSKLFLAADFRGVMKWWCLRSEVPFGPQMKEIIGKLASFLGTYHDGPNNSSAFEIILKGLVYVSDEHPERVLDAYRIAEFLVQIGTPVDAADIMGNHGLLYAMGCNNTRMACYPILADILYRGGANVNQQNRQGHSVESGMRFFCNTR